jgi:serine protease Do
MPDVRAVVAERGNAVVRIETYEQYLPGLVRRGARFLNPFPLRDTLGDALSLAFYIPSLILSPIRKHLGSGVIIDAEGHLLTNNHVVRNADEFAVHLTDAKGVRRKLMARLVGRDPLTDIALLKVDPAKAPLVVAPLGDSDKLALGDWGVIVGNPLKLTGSVSFGIVGGLHRQLGADLIEDHIQVDASVHPGNSGGPLFNVRGEVVGIVALGVVPANNTGFAIPTSLITPYLDDYKKVGHPRRGYLGLTVRDITPDVAEEERLDVQEGLLVTDVALFSPAWDAKVKEGDVVLSLDGKKVGDARSLQMAILRTRPGTSVALTLRRGKKDLDVTAKLTERREPFQVF